MGRRGNPYDNAKAESFMKTLKVNQPGGNVTGITSMNLELAGKLLGPTSPA
jgi:transposase InsO family protein